MRRFDTFNPAIPEETLAGSPDVPVYTDIDENASQKGTRRNVTRARKPNGKTSKAVKAEEKDGIFKRVNDAVTSRTSRWLAGLFMAFFAVYLGVAFISYFTTCVKDQSEINNTAIGYSADVANAAGEGGARLSEFLINEFFGLGSFVIIVWLAAVGLRLITGKPRFKPVNFTIKCIVALITVSLIVGLLTISMQSSVNWGGYHGRYVNEFIIHFFGWSGAVILAIFMVCCFVLICMRDVVKWGVAQKAKYDERRRIKRQIEEERLAREREIEEMRRAEDNGQTQNGEDVETIEGERQERPSEMSFADNGGLYSDIPDFDDVDYTYNLEDEEKDKNKGEEPDDDIDKEDQDKDDDLNDRKEEDEVSSGLRKSLEKEVYEVDSEDSGDKETATEAAVKDDEAIEPPIPAEEETEAESASENGVEMVVNVNQISQTNKKVGGTHSEIPEQFPYKFPSFDLLAEGENHISVDADEQTENKAQIERALLDFKIPIESIVATVGPTVTLYEIVPEKGIRISKIRSLVDDISRSLSAEQGVRIIAPIPGKGTVGIEVPNKDKQTVSMRTVLKSPAFQKANYKLPIALGSTISNEVFVADLAKMPHLLVAGATGQGKSVGLNAIIASLLYSKRPDELKFVMIDPKMVEFSLYAKVEGHYLAKLPDEEDAIITDMDKVVATLSSLCIEMDNRYQLLKEAATRNIIEYNDKIKARKLNPEKGHKFMPYIVVIVDEFSDLIMTAGKEVEMPIARLAQKARAVGIHVIVATQRPSTNVITGIIKANFPARMAFKVSSGVDSKTILDTVGAQQLIGRGDMLISNSGPMVRVQCAFIDTPEVEAICDHVAKQPYAQGAYILPEPASANGDVEGSGKGAGAFDEHDPLFEEVARLVVQTNNASTSSIQRRYRIGYNRAGSIMDQLEAAGVVGPAQGGKPRAVLMDPVSLDLLFEN